MSKALNAIVAGEIRPQSAAWQVATLSEIDAAGTCYVALAGADCASAARVLAGVWADLSVGREVLVAVPDDGAPVIVGAVADKPECAQAVGGHLRLTGEETVSIECGASAITLRRDGTVVIRGKNVISRASGENKLRGCTVKIN